jgi:hypothetical protein
VTATITAQPQHYHLSLNHTYTLDQLVWIVKTIFSFFSPNGLVFWSGMGWSYYDRILIGVMLIKTITDLFFFGERKVSKLYR